MMSAFALILASVVFVSAALMPEDFTNLQLENKLGIVADPRGHVTINLQNGWNMIPLKFVGEASGRYWSNFKEGQTCNMDVFQNVWYYSPVRGEYYHIPVIDDWRYPSSRNNNILLTEFQNKYYHIYSGSGWVYSEEDCILEGDDGINLISKSYGGDTGVGYNYKELILKAGWNFVPADFYWSALERSFADVFNGCEIEKINRWDSQNQKWLYTAEQMNTLPAGWQEKISPSKVFTTFVIKTKKDCTLAQNVIDGSTGSAPPTIPQ